jgi:hypothetical protein
MWRGVVALVVLANACTTTERWSVVMIEHPQTCDSGGPCGDQPDRGEQVRREPCAAIRATAADDELIVSIREEEETSLSGTGRAVLYIAPAAAIAALLFLAASAY